MRNFEDKGTPRVYKAAPTPKQGSEPSSQPPSPLDENGNMYGEPPVQPAEAAPQRRSAPPARQGKRPPAKKKANKLSQKQMNILIVGLIGLLVVLILAVILLPKIFGGAKDNEPVASSAIDSSLASDDASYDPDKNTIDPTKFVGTVLPESADAGVSYVEDTLFIGDSNIERMLGYREETNVTMKNAIGIVSMGVGDVPTLKCVVFKGQSKDSTMPEAVAIMQPMRVVMMFGTNNLGMNTEKFVEMYKKSAKAVHDAYPSAELIIASILPVYKSHTYGANVSQSTIDSYNKALVGMAEDENYKFLNWSEALKDEKTGFAKTGYAIPDGVHLSRAGATAMFQYFRTHSYQNEDIRPKPLKDIPQRGGTPPGLYGVDPSSFASKDPTSSVAKGVSVVYGVYNEADKAAKGGKITIGGNTATQLTQNIAPGATAAVATAVPDEGYRFVMWRVSVGVIADVSNKAVTFTVPGNIAVGESIFMTAVFEKSAVNIVASVWDETTNTAVGGSVQLGATSLAPGGQTSATATLTAGYSFVKWTISAGTINNPNSATMTLTIPADTAASSTITVTAVFRKNAVPQVNVPNYVGQAFTAVAAPTGWALAKSDVHHDTVPAGQIISQTVAAGSYPAAPAQTITLTVSAGPAPIEQVAVPDVSSGGATTLSAARVALEAAGFVVAVSNPGSDDGGRMVTGQNPAPGTTASKGSTVTLTLAEEAPVLP